MTQLELTEFTNAGGLAIALGTRNSELQPAFVRGFGISLRNDGKALSVFISKTQAAQTLANLKENGRAALVAAHVGTLTTRQFKGAYVSHTDVGESDLPSVEKNLTEFIAICAKYFGEQMAAQFRAFNIFPLIAVTFSIEDIFDQTPGPGAGKKIN